MFCIPLPPHAEPFSEAHEQRAMELAPWLRGAPPLPAPAAGERRAFLVLSQPVAYAPLPGHLRAYYASVEAVHEVSAEETEWL